jgi:amino acid transporter
MDMARTGRLPENRDTTNAISAPPRTVGFWGTALFPVNGMIGAGIFALPAVLAASVGNFAPWIMLVGGLLFMPLALVYAWLSARFEHSGGVVLYGEAAMGRFVGFQAGWARYASAVVTVAANTHVLVTYLAVIFPAIGGPTVRPFAVAGIIAAATVINLIGMRSAVRTLGAMTLVKIAPLLALVVAAFFRGEPHIGLTLPRFGDAETVLLLTYYAFMGFENVTEPAGEMKQPKRDVPRAVVSMVSAVTLLYMAVIWAYIAIAPTDAAKGNALAGAAKVAMGDVGALMIVIAAAFSIGANNFAAGTSVPRLTYAMAQRGMLPRWFGVISPRFGTPANSIIFYGAAGLFFGLWAGFQVLAIAGTLTRLVTYLICSTSLPILERRDGKPNRLHLAASAFAFVSSIWVATHAEAKSLAALAGLVALGSLLYSVAGRERRPAPRRSRDAPSGGRQKDEA